MFYVNELARLIAITRVREARACVSVVWVELTCFCSVRGRFIHGRWWWWWWRWPRRADDELRSAHTHAPNRIDINLIDIDTFVCLFVGVAELRVRTVLR